MLLIVYTTTLRWFVIFNLLKKFCGKHYNFNVFSSGRHLLVQYDSRQEYLVGDDFFDAVFEAVDRGKV